MSMSVSMSISSTNNLRLLSLATYLLSWWGRQR